MRIYLFWGIDGPAVSIWKTASNTQYFEMYKPTFPQLTCPNDLKTVSKTWKQSDTKCYTIQVLRS